MTAQQPELVTAAKTLLQWARTRQTVWRDPSTDIIAALGNRYQSFMDQAPADSLPTGPVPPPAPAPAASYVPVPPPLVAVPAPPAPPAPRAFVASPAPPVATPPPVAAPRPMIPPELLVTARPSIIPPKRPVPKAVWRPAPSEMMPRAQPRVVEQPKSGWMLKAMAGAGVIVAALAAPVVWREYKPRPAAAATPQTGSVAIDSTPPGSAVLIDGVERGTTPFLAGLPPGPHVLEFRYKKNVRTVNVTVTAGTQVTSSVDWTKRTAPRPRPQARADATPDAPAEKAETPAPDSPPAAPVEPPAADPR